LTALIGATLTSAGAGLVSYTRAFVCLAAGFLSFLVSSSLSDSDSESESLLESLSEADASALAVYFFFYFN